MRFLCIKTLHKQSAKCAFILFEFFPSFFSGALRALCEPAHGDPRAGVGSPSGAELRWSVCLVLRLWVIHPQQGRCCPDHRLLWWMATLMLICNMNQLCTSLICVFHLSILTLLLLDSAWLYVFQRWDGFRKTFLIHMHKQLCDCLSVSALTGAPWSQKRCSPREVWRGDFSSQLNQQREGSVCVCMFACCVCCLHTYKCSENNTKLSCSGSKFFSVHLSFFLTCVSLNAFHRLSLYQLWGLSAKIIFLLIEFVSC